MQNPTLLELHTRIHAITPEEIVAPPDERPVGAEVLGYAPFFLQQIFTVYSQLSDESESSPLGQKESRLTSYFTSGKIQSLTSEERSNLYDELEDVRARLSPAITIIDLLWMYLIAEASKIFQSQEYLHHNVTVYSDWSIAIRPEEDEDEEDEEGQDDPASALSKAPSPPRDQYN